VRFGHEQLFGLGGELKGVYSCKMMRGGHGLAAAVHREAALYKGFRFTFLPTTQGVLTFCSFVWRYERGLVCPAAAWYNSFQDLRGDDLRGKDLKGFEGFKIFWREMMGVRQRQRWSRVNEEKRKRFMVQVSGEYLASFYLIELKLFALKDVALARLQVKRSICKNVRGLWFCVYG
jgi:hypothetical protein